jgi:hypothetical protein
MGLCLLIHRKHHKYPKNAETDEMYFLLLQSAPFFVHFD